MVFIKSFTMLEAISKPFDDFILAILAKSS
jgi:hypothetical protein